MKCRNLILFLLMAIFSSREASALLKASEVSYDETILFDLLVEQIGGSCAALKTPWSSKKNIVIHKEKKCFDITCSTSNGDTLMASCLDIRGIDFYSKNIALRIKNAPFIENLRADISDVKEKCPSGYGEVKIINATVRGDDSCLVFVCMNPVARKSVPVSTVCSKDGAQKFLDVSTNPNYIDRPFECEYETDEHKAIRCPNDKRYVLEQKSIVNTSARELVAPSRKDSSGGDKKINTDSGDRR